MNAVFQDVNLLTNILYHANYKPVETRCIGKKANGKRCTRCPVKGDILCKQHKKIFVTVIKYENYSQTYFAFDRLYHN